MITDTTVPAHDDKPTPLVLADDHLGRGLKGWIILRPELNHWLGYLAEGTSVGWRKIGHDSLLVTKLLTGVEQQWSNAVEVLQVLTLKGVVVAFLGPMPRVREAKSMNGIYVPNPIITAPILRKAGQIELELEERDNIVAQIVGARQTWAERVKKVYVYDTTQLLEGAGSDGKDLRIPRRAVNFDFGLKP